MRLLRLLWVFFRVGAMGELAYRANFFLQLLESAVDLGTALGGLAVVFSYTTTLGGWQPEEVAALVGVFFLVGGAIRLIIQPSMEQLIESVREGTLDFTLTKPEDSQILVSIQRVEIWKLTDFVLGIVVIVVALARLGARVGVLQVAGFAAALIARRGHCVQLLGNSGLPFVLVRARGEHPGHLPVHLRGGALARDLVPGLAPNLPDLPGSRGIRYNRAGAGAGRQVVLADPG